MRGNSEYIGHTACQGKGCLSSDGLALYKEDERITGYCFSCETFFRDPLGERSIDEVSLDIGKRVENPTQDFKSIEKRFPTGKIPERSLNKDTCDYFGVRLGYNESNGEVSEHFYPYYKDNDLVGYKVRGVEHKSFSAIGSISGCELFGQSQSREGGKLLVITEGELDCMSAHQIFRGMGKNYNVVSLSFGANTRSIKANLEFVEGFESVVLAFDQDEKGESAAREVASLLSPGKAKIMGNPLKDISDLLMAGRGRELYALLGSAKEYRPDGIIRLSQAYDELFKNDSTESVPYPWEGLNKKLYGIRKGELVTITSGSGMGKALANSESVLTPFGFTTMGEISEGDLVVGEDGMATKVKYKSPQGIRKIFKMTFRDGTSVNCDGNHLWTVKGKRKKDWEVLTTNELMSRKLQTETLDSRNKSGKGSPTYNYRIPAISPVEFSGREIDELPLHPYVVGVLLGDGGMTTRTIKISNSNKGLLDRVNSLLPRGYKLSDYKFISGCYQVQVIIDHNVHCEGGGRGAFVDYIKGANIGDCLLQKSIYKSIPHSYKISSVESRGELLKGLNDTDGCWEGTRLVGFDVSSEALHGDYLFVSRSLGHTFSSSNRIPTFKGPDGKTRMGERSYRAYKVKSMGFNSIVSIDYSHEEEASCIAIDNESKLFITSGFKPTHNSEVVRKFEHHLFKKTPDNIGILALEENIGRTQWGIMSVEAELPLHILEERGDIPQERIRGWWEDTIGTGRFISYDHFGSTSEDNLINQIRYLIKGMDCQWIILDHLSIVVSSMDGGDERKTIDSIMTRLRQLVEETGVGMFLVSHLRRPSGDKGHEQGVEVSLSHLRGSQAIAQLSDAVISLERNQQATSEKEANLTTVRVLKNRYAGLTGIATDLYYNRETSMLEEVTDREKFLADAEADGMQFEDTKKGLDYAKY